MADMSDEEYERKLKAFKQRHGEESKSSSSVTNIARSFILNNKAELPTVPGKLESTVRGAASGALMGFEPQLYGTLKGLMPGSTIADEIEYEKQRNEQAWQANPAAYGAGYAGGTVGNMALTGGIGGAIKGAQAARAVPWASAADIAKSAVVEGAKGAAGSAGTSLLTKPTLGTATRAATGVAGHEINMPETPRTIDNRIDKSINANPPIQGQPLSQSEGAPSPFDRLANFLAQARESQNPDVQTAAAQAQAAVDPNDPDAKRKIAMILQGTPAGRAVGNSDSNLNQA